VFALDSLLGRSHYVSLEKHVWFKALALGLPHRVVLIRDAEEHFSLKALAPGLPNRKVLICDS